MQCTPLSESDKDIHITDLTCFNIYVKHNNTAQ